MNIPQLGVIHVNLTNVVTELAIANPDSIFSGLYHPQVYHVRDFILSGVILLKFITPKFATSKFILWGFITAKSTPSLHPGQFILLEFTSSN